MRVHSSGDEPRRSVNAGTGGGTDGNEDAGDDTGDGDGRGARHMLAARRQHRRRHACCLALRPHVAFVHTLVARGDRGADTATAGRSIRVGACASAQNGHGRAVASCAQREYRVTSRVYCPAAASAMPPTLRHATLRSGVGAKHCGGGDTIPTTSVLLSSWRARVSARSCASVASFFARRQTRARGECRHGQPSVALTNVEAKASAKTSKRSSSSAAAASSQKQQQRERENVDPGQRQSGVQTAVGAASNETSTGSAVASSAKHSVAASSPSSSLPPATPVNAVRNGATPDVERDVDDAAADATVAESTWSFAWPRLLLLGVAAIWGTNFATVKYIGNVDSLSVSAGAFARFSIAALALLPVTARTLWRSRRDLAFLGQSARLGAVVFAGYFVQAVGLAETTADKSAFMCSLTVVLVPFMERLLGKRIEARAWVSALVAILGVGLLELDETTVTSVGDLWSFGQAVFFGAGFMMLERQTREYPGRSFEIASLNLGSVALGSALWWLSSWVTSAHDVTTAIASAQSQLACVLSSPPVLGAVAYTGLVTTALAILMQTIALSRVSAGETSVIFCTEPLWAMAFSAALLGENMSAKGGVGGALIVAAVLIHQALNSDLRERLLGKRQK